MSGSVNLEEAATVAAEYISSLDNLPSEVQHLLQEIRYRETKSQDLQQEIAKESQKYIRHSLRASSPAPLPAKDAQLPLKINADYAEIDRLADEKVALAHRIADLITRARARLDHDLGRVLVLQGEIDAPTPYIGAMGVSGPRDPAKQITDSLRAAIVPSSPAPNDNILALTPVGAAGSVGASAQKKRRLASSASNASIKLPSPAPVSANPYATGQRSRLSQQVHPRPSPARSRRATMSVGLDADEDAEGEDDFEEGADGEEGGDSEDKQIYCFCRKLSYGEMIACDNKDCPYQWFHLPCVNLKAGVPLPESFYCDECLSKGVAAGVGGGSERQRKGRKK